MLPPPQPKEQKKAPQDFQKKKDTKLKSESAAASTDYRIEKGSIGLPKQKSESAAASTDKKI